jgi:hypothetical protein
MNDPGMKPEERASLSVHKRTRREFEKYLTKLSAKREHILTQDEGVAALLEFYNAHNGDK